MTENISQQQRTIGIKNVSQGLEYLESQVSEPRKKEEYWRKQWESRVGYKPGNPVGIQTLLGHTYSIILEKLAEEQMPIKPNIREFLDFLQEQRNGRSHFMKCVTLDEPSFDYAYGRGIFSFMIKKGLSLLESNLEIMREIDKDGAYNCEPDSLKFFVDRKYIAAGKNRRKRLFD